MTHGKTQLVVFVLVQKTLIRLAPRLSMSMMLETRKLDITNGIRNQNKGGPMEDNAIPTQALCFSPTTAKLLNNFETLAL